METVGSSVPGQADLGCTIMTSEYYAPAACRHQQGDQKPGGLAVVAIGNTLRADDGIAQAVCRALPTSVKKQACCFDLGTHTYFLIDCLRGHSAAIIIDSTSSDNPPGTITVLDLAELVASHSPLKCRFSHGISLLDELTVGLWRGLLPATVLFVGIEAASDGWGEQLSDTLAEKLPEVTAEVEKLIQGLLEGEKINA